MSASRKRNILCVPSVPRQNPGYQPSFAPKTKLAPPDRDRRPVPDGHQVAHVQIADAPGRGEPGTGRLDLDGYLARLERAGYAGWVGLEYKPTVPTVDSLAWLPRERRAGAEDGGAGGGTGSRAGSSREGSAP